LATVLGAQAGLAEAGGGQKDRESEQRFDNDLFLDFNPE